MDAMIGFLLGRSRRERWLLALLILVAVPAGLIYGVALPMAETRQLARQSVTEARAIEAWVADQAVIYAAQGPQTEPGQGDTAGALIGISGIEASLVDAGLRRDVTELANAADGGITLAFDTIRFTALSNWLATQAEKWGYDLAAFSFERGEKPDFVKADLRLVPRL